MKEKGAFKFKEFEVEHSRSSMKVGVDAVLLGAWINCEGARQILDVGTGCGIISLILAQRFPNANIIGVDIDVDSVEEANLNFERSLWSDRLTAVLQEFPKDFDKDMEKYDLIVSNPPYFNSGIVSPISPREKARHQDSLSPITLIRNVKKLLTPTGKLAMIFPSEFREDILEESVKKDLYLQRICQVRDNNRRPIKRVMVEIGPQEYAQVLEEELTLFEASDKREPTVSYRELCYPFYLKF